MSNPLVSVCVPCHNAGPYVEQALRSVLSQSYRELEIVLVNDASTDDTAEVLAKIDDPRLRVISQKCGSASKSRNVAFNNSKGSLVKFFDADDVLSLTMIEKQVARISDVGRAIASAEWGRFYDDDLSSYKSNPQSVWRDMDSKDWLIEAFQDARPMMQPGIFLIPRPLVEEVGPWDERVSPIDDFEFFTRLFSVADEIKFCEGERVNYRSGLEGALSGNRTRIGVEGALHSIRSGTDKLLEMKDTPEARSSCANIFQNFIYTYYPFHLDLCEQAKTRVRQLGGSDLKPDGPPRFQQLRKFIGWKLARRVQHLAGH